MKIYNFSQRLAENVIGLDSAPLIAVDRKIGVSSFSTLIGASTFYISDRIYTFGARKSAP